MLAVLKKEFKSYFLSPVGYVVIGIFLLVFSVFFYLTALSTGSVNLGGFYYYTALYGFNIRPSAAIRKKAEEEGVEIRLHNIIYKALEELQALQVAVLVVGNAVDNEPGVFRYCIERYFDFVADVVVRIFKSALKCIMVYISD